MNQLDDLVKSSPDDDTDGQKKRLDAALKRYKELMPAIEVTTTRSTIVVKSYEYQEVAEKRSEWLQDAGRRMKNDASLDDLQAVRVLLEEQEVRSYCGSNGCLGL